ncbi:hypothetical protein GYMLUDRAFT_253107 [Collybiopsis luxurians FD-317 M1]|uniref:Reverse transcriptase Ty1/copia-type domain-containing protein n=1 Tax=Collybiopsis luxurians FD-317 M1 TaxID=944289 RepID=A0A0D0AJC4_9AGAR|nr:hypothetical protein GYMLUDRAFT_253107 [Collybiopsis luxurians FD-317 M1]
MQDKILQYFDPPSAENTENKLVTPPIANPLPQREKEGPADEHPIALRKPVRAHKSPDEYWKVQPAHEPAPALAPRLPVPPANPNPNPEQSDSDSSSDDTDGEYGHVVNCLVEPQGFKEALNSPEADQWEQAMTEEITAHLTNGTWEIHKVDGTVECFKT